MATRSHIGKRNLDDTVDYIYCHWDGYPSNNGVILKDHYTTMDKVNELIELGDLRSLKKNIFIEYACDEASQLSKFAERKGWEYLRLTRAIVFHCILLFILVLDISFV